MTEIRITNVPIADDEDPYVIFTFSDDIKLKVTLSFEGDWLSMFEQDSTETESRQGFARELFTRIAELFIGEIEDAEGDDGEAA